MSDNVHRAIVWGSSHGDNQMLVGVPDHKIRVLSFSMISTGNTMAQIQDRGPTSAWITGPLCLQLGQPFVLPHNPNGWFETSVGNALYCYVHEPDVQFGGAMTYELVYVE